MKKILLGLAVVAVAVACNKDQRAVKKMDGTWKIDKVEYGTSNGTVTDNDVSGSITFNECKLKKDDYCSGNTAFTSGSVTITDNFQYRVINDGDKIEMRDDANDNTTDLATIEKLEKTELVIKSDEDSNGEFSRIYYSK